MQTLILTIHVLVCLALIGLVLLQSGKEGMGVIFGGGSSSLFGSTGAGGILAKLTAGAGVVFLLTSLTYNVMTSSGRSKGTESIMPDVQMEDRGVNLPAPTIPGLAPQSVPGVPGMLDGGVSSPLPDAAAGSKPDAGVAPQAAPAAQPEQAPAKPEANKPEAKAPQKKDAQPAKK